MKFELLLSWEEFQEPDEIGSKSHVEKLHRLIQQVGEIDPKNGLPSQLGHGPTPRKGRHVRL